MLLPLLLFVVALDHSTQIDLTNKVVDWPVLEERVHVVTSDVMHQHCDKYVGLLLTAKACSEWDFDKGTFDTWLVEGSNPDYAVHEHYHYLGYDHFGSTTMKDNWEEWKRGRTNSR